MAIFFDIHIDEALQVIAHTEDGTRATFVGDPLALGTDPLKSLLTHLSLRQLALEDYRTIGRILFEQIFGGEVATLLRTLEERSRTRGDALYLRLEVTPRWQSLPWEMMWDDAAAEFLSLTADKVIFRFVPSPVSPNPTTAPYRIAVLAASPSDLDTINAAQELAELTALFTKEPKNELIPTVEKTTRALLNHTIASWKPGIIHFIGHGRFENNQGAIALVDSENRSDWISEDDLSTALMGCQHVGLVTLNSCETASSGSVAFSGVGLRLVRTRVPAVVAMQWRVKDASAVTFSRTLYDHLRHGEPLPQSVQAARKQIAVEQGADERDAFAPVLFARGTPLYFKTTDTPAPASQTSKPSAEKPFVGPFAWLEQLYVPADAIFQRTQVSEFTGRSWLKEKIDNFLTDSKKSAGVFLLTGEAGVGKTAFMAHLVRERGYIHIFGEQVAGETFLLRALQSLAAQIISKHRLASYAQRDSFPQTLEAYPDFLERLLRLAARSLPPGEKIIIICDALDEVGRVPGGNALGLPSIIPESVYFIISQRPVPTHLSIRSPLYRETLESRSPVNLSDVETYITSATKHPEIERHLNASRNSKYEFVRTLVTRSSGNWMYVYYIIQEMRDGSRHPLALSQLPEGLTGYYAAYWSGWRDTQQSRSESNRSWETFYAPLLALLAATQEPITISLLAAWMGDDTVSHEVQRTLREQWRAFINEYRIPAAEPKYSLYHATLRDFLYGDIKTSNITPADQYLVDELREHTQEAHKRIASYYQNKYGNNMRHLVQDQYARKHYAQHLDRSNQSDQLFDLVLNSDEWWRARYAAEGSHFGYLTDLSLAQKRAETVEAWDLGRQVKCSLIESSIRSLAANIPADLLFSLLKTKHWSAAKAFSYAIHIPGDYQRANAIAKIAPLLPTDLLRDALDVISALRSEEARSTAITQIAAHLPSTLINDVLEIAKAIPEPYAQTMALCGLLRHLPSTTRESSIQATLYSARLISDYWVRMRGLLLVAQHLDHAQKEAIETEALDLRHSVPDANLRVRMLSFALQFLSQERKGALLQEALPLVHSIKDGGLRGLILTELAPHVPEEQRKELLQQATDALLAEPVEWIRADNIDSLLPHLIPAYLPLAFSLINSLSDLALRVRCLNTLADSLTGEARTQALTDALVHARQIDKPAKRAHALSMCLYQNPLLMEGQVLEEAILSANSLDDETSLALLLGKLAHHAPISAHTDILKLIRNMSSDFDRAVALENIFAALSPSSQNTAADVAGSLKNGWARIKALSGMAAQSKGTLQEDLTQRVSSSLQGLSAIDQFQGRLIAFDSLSNLEQSTVAKEAILLADKSLNDQFRAYLLKKVFRALPSQSHQHALTQAFNIQNHWILTETLTHIIPFLENELKTQTIHRYMRFIETMEGDAVCADAACKLAHILPIDSRAWALDVISRLRLEYIQAAALQRLAPILPDSSHDNAVQLGRKLKEPWTRARSLAAFAGIIEEHKRAPLFKEAMHAARTPGVQDNKYELAQALYELSKSARSEDKALILRDALVAAFEARGSWQNEDWPELVAALINGWIGATTSTEQRSEVLPILLHSMTQERRSASLRGLGELIPLVAQCANVDVISFILLSIRDVFSWWPALTKSVEI